MNFEFAIPSKNIVGINPAGHTAICTLWTPPEYVRRVLERGGADLSPENSPLALIGGLFGGGLKIMLRNLLYNPQIKHLILYGKDFSGVREHLMNFFAGRIERSGRRRNYIFADGSRRELELVTILGNESVYTMDELLLPSHFESPPQIIDIALDHTEELVKAVEEFSHKAYTADGPRLSIELPKPEVDVFPSEPHSHVVTAASITEAWEKILYRLNRFGKLVTFRNGKKRHELLNMKAVILNPGHVDRERLAYFNLPEEEIKEYQKSLLSAKSNDANSPYTYGSRIGKVHKHNGQKYNLLEWIAEDLAKNLDSRHNFITLWDNKKDMEGGESPCLVTLFFRKIGEKIDLTATFRSHNGTRAWPRNCFGLYEIMKKVCDLANERRTGRLFDDAIEPEPNQLVPGTLTVLSLSMSIDPTDLDQVQAYIDDYKNRKPQVTPDPCGYIKIAVDHQAREIVLQHYSPDNEILDEYRGDKPSALARTLYQREVISDLSHAMYIGMQLERAWHCLLSNKEYIQDKTSPLN